MHWSFRAFAIAGVAVRIHWTLPVVLLALIVQAVLQQGAASLPYMAAFVGLFWASILAHELGHCAAARSRGQPADDILLWPLGGLAYVGGGGAPRDEVAIAFAGPLASLLLAGLGLSVALLRGVPLETGLIDPFSGWHAVLTSSFVTALAVDVFKLNLLLGLFNLCVPAYPLDGGRILRGVLTTRIGFTRATEFSTRLAIAVAAVLGFWGLVQNQINLVLIGLFVGVQAFQERRLLREGERFGPDARFPEHDDYAPDIPRLDAEDAEQDAGRRESGLFSSIRRRQAERRARKRQEEEARLREQVDQLLDKVNTAGLASLAPDERRFLEEASRRFQEFDARR